MRAARPARGLQHSLRPGPGLRLGTRPVSRHSGPGFAKLSEPRVATARQRLARAVASLYRSHGLWSRQPQAGAARPQHVPPPPPPPRPGGGGGGQGGGGEGARAVVEAGAAGYRLRRGANRQAGAIAGGEEQARARFARGAASCHR